MAAELRHLGSVTIDNYPFLVIQFTCKYQLSDPINFIETQISYNLLFLLRTTTINFKNNNYKFLDSPSLMILGHSLIALTGALLVYDWIRFRSQKKNEKHQVKTIKLCLTGGPCGGKSQGIECIYSTFKQVSAPFFIVPEAATLIGSSGLTLDFCNFNSEQIQAFQIYLMRLQYNLEGILTDVAKTLEKLGKCPVLLCDRGLLDGKAYAGKKNWDRMLKLINITQEQINQRYEAVIHMQTAARGAQQNYFYVPPEQQNNNNHDQEQKGNKTRKQPPEVAIDLDQKVQACYQDHPFRFVIRNYFFVKNFEMKKVLLIAQVNQILEFVLKKVNIEHYYTEYPQFSKDGQKLDAKVAYLERKKKYQKFINRSKSYLKR